MTASERNGEARTKIAIRDVSFDYVDRKTTFAALNHISLDIRDGEFLCILGSSGCGKSTLLSLLSGLNRATAGEILLDGKAVRGPGPDRAVVFQQYSLFPWLTARGNVMFAIRQSGRKYSRKERADGQLSGGMKQRVAVARALALESDVLLLDEPFAAIDPKLRQELQELISSLCAKQKKTVVFVTHDIDEAILLGDRIIVMEPGRIRTEVEVNLPHPRKRDDLIGTPAYEALHRKLIAGFYAQVRENIDTEVLL